MTICASCAEHPTVLPARRALRQTASDSPNKEMDNTTRSGNDDPAFQPLEEIELYCVWSRKTGIALPCCSRGAPPSPMSQATPATVDIIHKQDFEADLRRLCDMVSREGEGTHACCKPPAHVPTLQYLPADCRGDQPCPAGTVCDNGMCVPECPVTPCSGNSICVDGFCLLHECVVDQHCPFGWACVNGKCVEGEQRIH